MRQGSPSFVWDKNKDFLSTFPRQIFTVSETGPYTVTASVNPDVWILPYTSYYTALITVHAYS